MAFTAVVITCSDRCSRGEAEDTSGPTVAKILAEHLRPTEDVPPIIYSTLVPDDKTAIKQCVLRCCDGEHLDPPVGCVDGVQKLFTALGSLKRVDLIVTTGGTGFSERDTTPEAVTPLFTRVATGLQFAMFKHSMDATPYGWLSRGVAGIRHNTTIITLPGSRKAVAEILEPVLKYGLVHAVSLARGFAQDPHPKPAEHVDPAPKPVGQGPDCCGHHHHKHKKVPINPNDVTERARESQFEMLTMTEAWKVIEAHSPTAGEQHLEMVNTSACLGRVLAADVTATFPHPPFRASMKDGYAVISSDGIGDFKVVGSLTAGATADPNFKLEKGQICRVSTGGFVPEGADAVMQVEDTELIETRDAGNGKKEEAVVRILSACTPGWDIRPPGSDMPVGGLALKKGSHIGCHEIALARSIGAPKLPVVKLPVVGVLSTGDELATVDESSSTTVPPPHGKIYDSNRGMLMAAVAQVIGSTATVFDAGLALDNMEATKKTLQAAIDNADVVLSSGGVSMGEVDCMKRAIMELGGTIHFGRVEMKPGKPTTFATFPPKTQGGRERLFFALPGNPVSSMVSFHLFVCPALRRFSGYVGKRAEHPLVKAKVVDKPLVLDQHRPEYHRCYVSFDFDKNCLVCKSTGPQVSSRLLSMSGSNGLIQLPAGSQSKSQVAVGEEVTILMIGPLDPATGKL